MKGSNIVFSTTEESVIDDRLVIITGCARSGTSLLGRLISTLKDVEFEYEPDLINYLPYFAQEGVMEERLATGMLKADLEDLFINHILGRNVNLRDTDLSLKTIGISEEDLRRRWKDLKNRQDAQAHIQEHGSLMIIKQVNMQPFIDYFLKSLKGVRIIHIVRNAFDTALSMEKKEWYSEETLEREPMKDLRKAVTIDGEKKHIPWWVKDEKAEEFIKSSDYERSLDCWLRMLESFQEAKGLTSENYLEITYEDLLVKTDETVKAIEEFTGKQRTTLTNNIIMSVNKENVNKNKDHQLEKLAEEKVAEAQRLMELHGYDARSN